MTEIERRERILDDYTAAIIRNKTAIHQQEMREEQWKRQEVRMKDMQKDAESLARRIKNTKSPKERQRLRGVLDKRIDQINSAKANEILYKPNPALDIEKRMIESKEKEMNELKWEQHDSKRFELTYQKMVKDISNGKPAGIAMAEAQEKHWQELTNFKNYLKRAHPEQFKSLDNSFNNFTLKQIDIKQAQSNKRSQNELKEMQKNQKSREQQKEQTKKQQEKQHQHER